MEEHRCDRMCLCLIRNLSLSVEVEESWILRNWSVRNWISETSQKKKLHTVAEVMEEKNQKQQTKLADIRLCYKKAVDFQLQSTISELDTSV